ncbi:MAG: hypothetical protein IKD15_02975 [Clostridia bacterium]|nr:hypothetical protein [Clostridia bacterium]
MENQQFNYNYSAARNKEVENIRSKYIPREENKLETLKRLDKRVRAAGMLESLCLGIVGVLIFGIGMCFFLDVFAGGDWLAALFMVLGAIVMAPAYPIYKYTSRRKKEALAPEILRLSEEIMNS